MVFLVVGDLDDEQPGLLAPSAGLLGAAGAPQCVDLVEPPVQPAAQPPRRPNPPQLDQVRRLAHRAPQRDSVGGGLQAHERLH